MNLKRCSQLLYLVALTSVFGFAGCSARPTMDDLEREAIATGDWSDVEKRQQMNRRMGLVDPDRQCPGGEALLCQQKGEREVCECVSSQLLRNDRH